MMALNFGIFSPSEDDRDYFKKQKFICRESVFKVCSILALPKYVYMGKLVDILFEQILVKKMILGVHEAMF